MRRVNHLLFVLIGVVGLTMAGCSKNESTTASEADKSKAVERVDQANQILVPKLAILISTQTPDTSLMNMSAAKSLYEEALSYDPDNQDAHFGVAVSELITAFADPSLQSALGKSGANAGPGAFSTVFKNKTGLAGLSSVVEKQFQSTTRSLIAPAFMLQLRKPFAVQAATEPVSYYQGIVENKILPSISDAITHLNEVTKHSDFAFYITPSQLGEQVGDSIRIGLTEVYAVLAVCQLVDAGASAFVSYNLDYNPTDGAAVKQAWTSGSAFFALRNGGAQRMKDTKTNLLGALASVKSGLQFLQQHPGGGIIPYRPEDQIQLAMISSVIDSLTAVMSGPVQITEDINGDGMQESLRLDMSKLFDNAIPDFKTKMPAYTVGVSLNNGYYDAVLTWQATSFTSWTIPDPSFNGLFPAITTDQQFKQTFGITAASWQQSVVIPGNMGV